MRTTSKTDVSVLGAERGDRVRFPHGPPGMGSSSACCRKGHPIVGKSAVIYGVDWCSFTDRLNDYFYYLSLSRSFFFCCFVFACNPMSLKHARLLQQFPIVPTGYGCAKNYSNLIAFHGSVVFLAHHLPARSDARTHTLHLIKCANINVAVHSRESARF